MPLPPSAADWTRFKRLMGAGRAGLEIDVRNDIDLLNVITPPSCSPSACQSRAGIRRDHDQIVGSSKTRREASRWTDSIAFQGVDFVTISEYPGIFGSFGRQRKRQELCGENTLCPPVTVVRKVPTYKSSLYQHLRLR
jgi:hypothetical protein